MVMTLLQLDAPVSENAFLVGSTLFKNWVGVVVVVPFVKTAPSASSHPHQGEGLRGLGAGYGDAWAGHAWFGG